MYGQREFDLNRKLKTALYEGAGIVWVGEKEIGAYVSFYSKNILDLTYYNIEERKYKAVSLHQSKIEYKCGTLV